MMYYIASAVVILRTAKRTLQEVVLDVVKNTKYLIPFVLIAFTYGCGSETTRPPAPDPPPQTTSTPRAAHGLPPTPASS
jgi:hypothetical protein